MNLPISRASTKLLGTSLPYLPFGSASVNVEPGTIQPGRAYLPANAPLMIKIGSLTQATTTGNNGAFAVNFPTQTLTGGQYSVEVDYAGDKNYLPLSDSSMQLLITQLTPAFTNLTPSQTIPVGTQVVLLSGKMPPLEQHGPQRSDDGGHLGIESNRATINSDGTFSIPFPTSTIPASANPYDITYEYQGDSNFKPWG